MPDPTGWKRLTTKRSIDSRVSRCAVSRRTMHPALFVTGESGIQFILCKGPGFTRTRLTPRQEPSNL
jgi:hypothetical protein